MAFTDRHRTCLYRAHVARTMENSKQAETSKQFLVLKKIHFYNLLRSIDSCLHLELSSGTTRLWASSVIHSNFGRTMSILQDSSGIHHLKFICDVCMIFCRTWLNELNAESSSRRSTLVHPNLTLCVIILFFSVNFMVQQQQISKLEDRLREKPELNLYFLFDLNRSTRPGPSSTAKILLPLLREFPSRVHISMFRSPNLRGLLAKLVPPRFNEGWGTWHAKIYGADDDVMISGWVSVELRAHWYLWSLTSV